MKIFETLKSIVFKFLELKYRVRPLPIYLISAGIGLIFVASSPLPSIVIGASKRDADFKLSIGETPGWFLVSSFILGAALIGAGLILAIIDVTRKWKADARKRRLVFEIRALDLTVDKTIEAFLSSVSSTQIEPRFLDLRKSTPAEAISEISTLTSTIGQAKRGRNENDLEIWIGGLAHVPYMFLAGNLLTSQSTCSIVDWHRDEGSWKPLDQPDDNERLPDSSLLKASLIGSEVALGISTSYGVNEEAFSKTFGHLPHAVWSLPNKNVHSHWSKEKQTALAAQFRDLLVELDASGVRLVHLVLVAQASVVINFGRQLHRRNMPEVRIYQYEPQSNPPYPWSVVLPKNESIPPRIEPTGV